jgi:preprotein translocase subunit SecF
MELFKQTNIDFMRIRKPALVLSTLVNLIAIGSLIFQGLNLGLDFTGGTVIEVGYKAPVELSEVRTALSEGGFEGPTVQHFGTSRDVMIRLPPTADADSATVGDRVFAALSQSAGEGQVDLRRVEFVGPQVGQELVEKGGLAILYSLIGILIYVAVRFEWRLAVAAIIATIHDVIVTLAVFSLFQIEFDLTVLAAVLAVIGYSLNDTVVIFDRIRENFRKIRKGTVLDIVNRAVNDTMSRTIITSGTTFIVVLTLYLFGGQVIHGFALALVVGIGVGTYSSIYVASSAAVLMGISRADLMPTPKEGAEGDVRP